MRQIVLIAHNLRSSHKVGSLLRTADGLGLSKVCLTGYTPYPLDGYDNRLLHQAQKINKQIQKTALGAELSQLWEHSNDITEVISTLKKEGFTICALEQAPNATLLQDFQVPKKLAIIVGRETEGIEPEVLKLCDQIVMIPMQGKKESFNVVQAAAMCLYHAVYVG